MKKNKLFWLLWAGMYVICTVCSFFPIAAGFLSGLFVVLSLGFFVPPGILIYRAVWANERTPLKIIRNLSLLSLGLTLVLILLNFATVTASEEWGLVMYWLLIFPATG